MWRSLSSWAVLIIVIASGAGAIFGRAPIPTANPESAWPSSVVARVGGRPIQSQEFDVALAQFSYDLRPSPFAGDRRAILERLIDEELLYQDGVERNLQESDPVVRLGIVRIMLALICAPTTHPGSGEDRSTLNSPESLSAPTVSADACADRQSQHRLDEYLVSLRSRATIKISHVGGP